MTAQPRDTKNLPVPVFTPARVQAVTADEPWTPGKDDRVFSVPVADVKYKINDGTEINIAMNRTTGIVQGFTYTFDTTTNIEVM